MKKVFCIIVASLFVASVALALNVVDEGKVIQSRDNILPTRGIEKGSSGGDSKIPPEACSTHVVADGIDYGGDFSSPLNYSSARHVAQALGFLDVPYVVWEVGGSFNNHVRGSYWDDVGPYWAPPKNIDLGTIDAGRIGLASDPGGYVHACWHEDVGAGNYETMYARWSPLTGNWEEHEHVSGDPVDDAFPSITVDPDGNPWVVWIHGEIGAETDAFCNHSWDGGETWSSDTIEQITDVGDIGARGSWVLPVVDAAPNGDIHFALAYDANDDGWMDVNYTWRDHATGIWQPMEIVAEATPGVHPMALPSLAVDTAGYPHIVYQENGSDQGGGTGLSGWGTAGPCGQLWYTNRRWGLWSRAQGLPFEYPGGWNGVAASEMPNIGIDNNNCLHVVTGEPPMAYDDGEGAAAFFAFNACCIAGTLNMAYDACWEYREWVSSNLYGTTVNAIMPQITQKVPDSGPGIVWSDMDDGTQPARVLYHHLQPGLPPACDVETVQVLSPPDSSGLEDGVQYEVVLETQVNQGSYRDMLSYDAWAMCEIPSVTKNGGRDTAYFAVFNFLNIPAGSTAQDTFEFYFVPDFALAAPNEYYWTFWVAAPGDTNLSNDTLYFNWPGPAVEEALPVLPERVLFSAAPNPVSSSSKIMFSLPIDDYVSLKIYDITGRVVKELIDKRMKGGVHSFEHPLQDLTAGVYFYRLNTTQNGELTRKMVIVR